MYAGHSRAVSSEQVHSDSAVHDAASLHRNWSHVDDEQVAASCRLGSSVLCGVETRLANLAISRLCEEACTGNWNRSKALSWSVFILHCFDASTNVGTNRFRRILIEDRRMTFKATRSRRSALMSSTTVTPRPGLIIRRSISAVGVCSWLPGCILNTDRRSVFTVAGVTTHRRQRSQFDILHRNYPGFYTLGSDCSLGSFRNSCSRVSRRRQVGYTYC